MTFLELPLAGAFRIEPKILADARGSFLRVFCERTFRERGLLHRFPQANHSVSARRGIVRGLHYQLPPFAEAKLIRCVKGEIQDVLVDLRKGSPTFLCWHSELLSQDNRRMVYVPRGFAHGFQALTDGAEATYQSSAEYAPAHERLLRHDDPRVGIAWLAQPVLVSDKDRNAPDLPADFEGVDLGAEGSSP